MSQNSCHPVRVAARIGASFVARLGNRTTIAFTGRIAITNSGCNAHVFHYVRHSKSRYDYRMKKSIAESRMVDRGITLSRPVWPRAIVTSLKSSPRNFHRSLIFRGFALNESDERLRRVRAEIVAVARQLFLHARQFEDAAQFCAEFVHHSSR